MTPDAKLEPHPQTIFTALSDGEGVLLHLETQKTYTLNATGRRIWELIAEGRTLNEISQTLQAEFTVDAVRAEQSVEALTNELVDHALLVHLP